MSNICHFGQWPVDNKIPKPDFKADDGARLVDGLETSSSSWLPAACEQHLSKVDGGRGTVKFNIGQTRLGGTGENKLRQWRCRGVVEKAIRGKNQERDTVVGGGRLV